VETRPIVLGDRVFHARGRRVGGRLRGPAADGHLDFTHPETASSRSEAGQIGGERRGNGRPVVKIGSTRVAHVSSALVGCVKRTARRDRFGAFHARCKFTSLTPKALPIVALYEDSLLVNQIDRRFPSSIRASPLRVAPSGFAKVGDGGPIRGRVAEATHGYVERTFPPDSDWSD
jgi:hypothetical protein